MFVSSLNILLITTDDGFANLYAFGVFPVGTVPLHNDLAYRVSMIAIGIFIFLVQQRHSGDQISCSLFTIGCQISFLSLFCDVGASSVIWIPVCRLTYDDIDDRSRTYRNRRSGSQTIHSE